LASNAQKAQDTDADTKIERVASILFTFIFWGLIATVIAFIALSELAQLGLRDAVIGGVLIGLALGWLAATLNIARRIAGFFAGLLDIAGWFS